MDLGCTLHNNIIQQRTELDNDGHLENVKTVAHLFLLIKLAKRLQALLPRLPRRARPYSMPVWDRVWSTKVPESLPTVFLGTGRRCLRDVSKEDDHDTKSCRLVHASSASRFNRRQVWPLHAGIVRDVCVCIEVEGIRRPTRQRVCVQRGLSVPLTKG